MRVFHGGSTEIKESEIRAGKFTKDFGDGFYETSLKCLSFVVMLPKMVGDIEQKERKVGRTAARSSDYFPFFLLSLLRK